MPQPVAFAYDPVYGHLTTMKTYRDGAADFRLTWPDPEPTAPAPDVTQWQRSPVSGRLNQKIYADGSRVTYGYDVHLALQSRLWARNQSLIEGNTDQTTYAYDHDTGQLTSIDYSDNTPDIAFTYDRLGRIATVTDALGTRTFTYNAALQLESESIAGPIYDATITRVYEDQTGVPGRYAGFTVGPVPIGDPPLHEVQYGYDTFGRMDHITGTALPAGGVEYAYLATSDLIERIQYKADATTVLAETVRGYEPKRDLLTSTENKWNATVISKYDYTYDALGRRTNVVNSGSAFTTHSQEAYSSYTYNPRNELERSQRFEGTDPQAQSPIAVIGQDFEYHYDPIGNRTDSSIDQATATTYAANNLNQYTSTSNPTETFTYDDDGNLTADSDFVYSYDGENRLVSVAEAQWPDHPILEFTYDYHGRRVRKVEYYPVGSPHCCVIEDTRFVYDGWNVILELDGKNNNAVQRKYAWGLDLSGSTQGAGGIGGLLALQDTADTTITTDDEHYLYFYDGNGNVGQLIDWEDSPGTIVAHYEYDPYGNLITAAGSYWQANLFRFSTKYFDEETGFYYYGYRYYDPRFGRWLNRDPIREDGGINIYTFSLNNPTNQGDALGLKPYQNPPLGSSSPCGAFLLCPRNDIVVPEGPARRGLAGAGHNVNALEGFEVIFLRKGHKTLRKNNLGGINNSKTKYPDCDCACGKNGNIRLVQAIKWEGAITGTANPRIDQAGPGEGGAGGKPPPGMKPPGRTQGGTIPGVSFVDGPYNPRTVGQSTALLEVCAFCTQDGKEVNLGCFTFKWEHGKQENGVWVDRGLTDDSIRGVRKARRGPYKGCFVRQPGAPGSQFNDAVDIWSRKRDRR